MKTTRLAAIDIGTNTIRCIVVEVEKQGKFRVLDDEKAAVRLGTERNGTISKDAWQMAMDTLLRMKKITDGFGVKVVEAVATSAVRRAPNGEAFVTAVSENVGLRIMIISGEEEAELAALSVFHNFNMAGKRYVIVDIGGGSTEVVTAFGTHIEEKYSLELGAVILTNKFITTDPIRTEEYRKSIKHIRKTIQTTFSGPKIPVQCILGSGGAMASIAAMVMAQRKEGFSSVHGYEVLRSEIVHLRTMLMQKSLKERKSLPGLSPDRADIIVAGVMVVDELMAHFKANILKINERGIREGLVLKAMKKYNFLPAVRKLRNWRDSVLEFARSCQFDEEHSLQVAKLAMKIFDTVAPSFNLREKERQLLEAAALLHDIGYFISYTNHHKHTYHLIHHANLFGFTPREREIIAQSARYHRKSLPKKKHESFSLLAPKDRLLVERIGGIVRLADGLDRRRNGMVTALDCSLSSSALKVRLFGEDDLSVEIFGGRAKGDLFRSAFDRSIYLDTAKWNCIGPY